MSVISKKLNSTNIFTEEYLKEFPELTARIGDDHGLIVVAKQNSQQANPAYCHHTTLNKKFNVETYCENQLKGFRYFYCPEHNAEHGTEKTKNPIKSYPALMYLNTDGTFIEKYPITVSNHCQAITYIDSEALTRKIKIERYFSKMFIAQISTHIYYPDIDVVMCEVDEHSNISSVVAVGGSIKSTGDYHEAYFILRTADMNCTSISKNIDKEDILEVCKQMKFLCTGNSSWTMNGKGRKYTTFENKEEYHKAIYSMRDIFNVELITYDSFVAYGTEIKVKTEEQIKVSGVVYHSLWRKDYYEHKELRSIHNLNEPPKFPMKDIRNKEGYAISYQQPIPFFPAPYTLHDGATVPLPVQPFIPKQDMGNIVRSNSPSVERSNSPQQVPFIPEQNISDVVRSISPLPVVDTSVPSKEVSITEFSSKEAAVSESVFKKFTPTQVVINHRLHSVYDVAKYMKQNNVKFEQIHNTVDDGFIPIPYTLQHGKYYYIVDKITIQDLATFKFIPLYTVLQLLPGYSDVEYEITGFIGSDSIQLPFQGCTFMINNEVVEGKIFLYDFGLVLNMVTNTIEGSAVKVGLDGNIVGIIRNISQYHENCAKKYFKIADNLLNRPITPW